MNKFFVPRLYHRLKLAIHVEYYIIQPLILSEGAYSVCSENVKASQTIRMKILLIEFHLLKLYRIAFGNLKLGEQILYTCIIVTPADSHLSKILRKYCDVLLNPSLWYLACIEGLHLVEHCHFYENMFSDRHESKNYSG